MRKLNKIQKMTATTTADFFKADNCCQYLTMKILLSFDGKIIISASRLAKQFYLQNQKILWG
jgi:hypothetical protein